MARGKEKRKKKKENNGQLEKRSVLIGQFGGKR